MQPEREPYFIDYGEYREFRFFQSDYRFILTFCRHYPKVLSNKWAIVTAFDYAILLPPGEAEYDAYKSLNDKPFKFQWFDELPSSGNGDEYYFFNQEVDVSSLKVLTEVQPFDSVRLSNTDLKSLDANFEQLNQIEASAYVFFGIHTTVIFKDAIDVEKFIESSFYKAIPQRHIEEHKARIRALRNAPTSNKQCAQRGCKLKSVYYGVNCPKHHYRMLHGSENLKMLFDEPLPGEERRSISLENMGDRILLGIIAILLISFSVLIVCFVLASN